MSDVNFVPEDYIQKKESQKTNVAYLILFIVVMVILGGGFGAIKIRQSVLTSQEEAVDVKLAKAQEDLARLDVIQKKMAQVMKSASMSKELIEPVPRSVIIASLVNSLPDGVFLSEVSLKEKEKTVEVPLPKSKYEEAKKKKLPTTKKIVKKITTINIDGYAYSDVFLAGYIAKLSQASMFEHVLLDQSKESKFDGKLIRKYKLNAKLREGFSVSEEDINDIVENGKSVASMF